MPFLAAAAAVAAPKMDSFRVRKIARHIFKMFALRSSYQNIIAAVVRFNNSPLREIRFALSTL